MVLKIISRRKMKKTVIHNSIKNTFKMRLKVNSIISISKMNNINKNSNNVSIFLHIYKSNFSYLERIRRS